MYIIIYFEQSSLLPPLHYRPVFQLETIDVLHVRGLQRHTNIRLSGQRRLVTALVSKHDVLFCHAESAGKVGALTRLNELTEGVVEMSHKVSCATSYPQMFLVSPAHSLEFCSQTTGSLANDCFEDELLVKGQIGPSLLGGSKGPCSLCTWHGSRRFMGSLKSEHPQSSSCQRCCECKTRQEWSSSEPMGPSSWRFCAHESHSLSTANMGLALLDEMDALSQWQRCTFLHSSHVNRGV